MCEGRETGTGSEENGMAERTDGTCRVPGSSVKIPLRIHCCKNALPEMSGFGKIYQNGLSTTINTMIIISMAGASFMMRQ